MVTIWFDLTCDPIAGVAIFRIQDQGIGIPEADQTRLFESFYRASNVQSIQGTGLGLVIVKRCVEAHHGQIEVSKSSWSRHYIHNNFAIRFSSMIK